ncbi:hypothetical protein LTR36_007089 [Oleoguttula mirabilis]|uniref:Sodium/calcium exchanger membrane region domain-containing protein n=1 Tax=Oleoguttula mirabilis TaxID=1507867 RepID=A0AAV9JAD3_9PEZI|nr:hypothetical protein LTR36_007089 [Oleoguttula mirabilis]
MSPTHPQQAATRRKMLKPTRKHQSYRAARAFYLTLFIGTCLATYAILRQPYAPEHSVQHDLQRRADVGIFQTADEECRLVHRAKDQCTFIKAHCPDDEAGFTAYLELFYCKLPHVKAVGFIILIAWLGLLFSTIGIAASDFFCINLSTIASILGMSESMAGVTLLAFGNGSPDVFSTFAAMSTNSGSLAVGELFGAAGFITAVVAGSMALIRPFHVAKKSFIRDVGFFVVAAAFSMVFLWDGKLHLWECLTMVIFYVFYVTFVVVWHWWIGRRRRRREKEAAARGHFMTPGDELDLEEEYHDDPEEAGESARPSVSRGVSREDWSALERGASYTDGNNEEDEEEVRDRWMSELSSNMRLTRSGARSRKNTLSSVRPSLVGALEFQAVLSSLQKSRNIQTIPLNARRYSDDPSFTTAQQQDHMSSTSDPAARPPFQVIVDDGSPKVERLNLDVPKSAPARTRAVSANDALGLRIDPDLRRPQITPPNGSLIDVSDFGARSQQRPSLLDIPGRSSQPQSPSLEVSPASPRSDAPLTLDTSMEGTQSPDHLALPSARSGVFRQALDHFAPQSLRRTGTDSPHGSPRTVPSARQLPKIIIPREERSRNSSPSLSPLRRYRDDPSPASSRPPSLYLPPAIASPESLPFSQSAEQEAPERPISWWPYKVMPPLGLIVSTLFPTIYHWHEKNWWEKCLGIVAAPSVFLLTITLPVVENNEDGDSSEAEPKDLSFDSTRSKSISGAPGQSVAGLKGVSREEVMEDMHPGGHQHSLARQGAAGHGNVASLAIGTEQHERHNFGEGVQQHHASFVLDQPVVMASPAIMDETEESLLTSQPPELWNRWLTIIQLFLAPLFVVLSIYSQSPTDMSPTWLIRPTLISLLISLILLIPFLLTTTPTHRPAAYRTIFSLAGFTVSIAWISTIAAQVVGALKALAVILNMSHAIMGLTIFAVGNSLGDLVADVTVARLGYPVMALSACFGGPMLNILLGIGLSGSWILITGAERRHDRHPDKAIKFKSYHIDVSSTLIVSGATLLVTLVGLLVFVPLNKWVLDKRIGWALIAVWTLSTIGNVVLEVTGWGDGGSEG